ncbi:Pentatricopeptide repeat-containing protein [Heracleum sosnowskyi]|uniref:Pentatricopeptide repeat-containing protein n=1 Tax=Heracleum sosnowskyi TaxID=360622 RepID=A0AAD8IZ29_9APIA|nr:Pentatricopeptide repeat-containing protein [Heracleum sosnowskyi]
MWALRRSSISLKNRGITFGSFRAGCAKVEVASCYQESDAEIAGHAQVISDRFVCTRRYHQKQYESLEFYIGKRHLSSHAGMKSTEDEEDDLGDGFSELETSVGADENQARSVPRGSNDDLISDSELSHGGCDDEVAGLKKELELSDIDAKRSKKKFEQKRTSGQLFNAVISAPGLSIKSVLDKWIEDGNEVNKSDILMINLNLRKRKMYGRALQILEWSADRYEFSERDYASHLDLTAKVQGLIKAEQYIEEIPKAYRGEVVYRTYLANCVATQNVKKSEEVFNKMKDLGLPLTAFTCNQLLLLYKRTDKKKMADVLVHMENENVKPTVFTYNLLIDTKGLSRDITGMDQIVETMKEEGIEPINHTLNIMAKHYISAGFKDKAEAVAKEMEGGDLRDNRAACRYLLVLYSLLGKADEVARIWKLCQSDANSYEYVAAIEAFGRLKKIKEATEVFEQTRKRWPRSSVKVYSNLLKVYADNKMLTEGRDLVKQMAESGCVIGPLVWDSLVRLHVDAGEVEKADTILHKAIQQKQMKPLFNSFIAIMEQYSTKGDVHNAEKIFHRMRQAGYVARLQQFQILVKTYVNGKTPAYGMNQRMKADNIFPNLQLALMLVQVDPFKKTPASESLD